MSQTPATNRTSAGGGWARAVRSRLGIGSVADWVFKRVCGGAAGIILVVVALIVVLLFLQARPAFMEVGWELVLSKDWNPSYDPRADEENPRYVADAGERGETPEEEKGRFGGAAFVYGSVVTSIL